MVAAVVKQQFEVGRQILGHGLVSIVEPEVSIKSPDNQERRLSPGERCPGLDALPAGRVMLKLTIPTFRTSIRRWSPQASPARRPVRRLYPRRRLRRRLAANHGMIASFSRALREGLTHSMSDADLEATLANYIDDIYQASTVKV